MIICLTLVSAALRGYRREQRIGDDALIPSRRAATVRMSTPRVLSSGIQRRGYASLFTDHGQALKKGHQIIVKNHGPATQLTRLDLPILDGRIHGGATNLRKNTRFGNGVSKLGHELLHGLFLACQLRRVTRKLTQSDARNLNGAVMPSIDCCELLTMFASLSSANR